MAKKIVSTLGVVFIALGVLGFFWDPLLGVFEVDTVHNIVHLASGLLALMFAARGEESARTFAKIFGVVYALVAILGLIVGGDSLLGIMEINGWDNILHVVLAVLLLYAGFGARDRSAA